MAIKPIAIGTTSGGLAEVSIDDTNGDTILVESTGNVGIGKTSPATKLDVNGTTTTSAISIAGEIVEGVHTLTGTTPALDPANGTIQTWTLSGNSTPTDSLATGESVLLLIDDGTGYTITWPTMEWIGGSAPTLDTANTNVIELWKVGSTLYGALVGVSS